MMKAPIRLPFRLPRPPSTTIASMVTSGDSHMKGSTTNTGATTTPATAARAAEIATVSIATRFTFMPIRFAISRSFAVVRIARPSRVRLSRNQVARRTTATAARTTRR